MVENAAPERVEEALALAEAVGRWLGAENAPLNVIHGQECVLAALREAQEREERLRKRVEEALQFADDGWAYASPYFREKWDYEGERSRLAALAPADEAKP